MQEKMKTVLIPRGRKNEENFVLVSVNGRNARMMEDDARSYVDRMAN